MKPLLIALVLLALVTGLYLGSLTHHEHYTELEGKELYVPYANVYLTDHAEWACFSGKLFTRSTYMGVGFVKPSVVAGNHLECWYRDEAYWEDYAHESL